ncbi:MAG TPA: hypothetical protein VN030_09515 [Cellvibrio sp.]|nr:hypothetical protein [Cellvibrio sp.]
MDKKSSVTFETIEFAAGDGMRLNLLHARADLAPTKAVVLLVHGAGVRANIFNAPVETTIVEFLVAQGYDVWLENWRASIDIAPNNWSLDKAAVYDHPQAVKKIIELTGATSIKAIIHCQGSTSFMMSAVAGLVPQVDTIISNAVSLFPLVTPFSKWKINIAPHLIRPFTRYLNAQSIRNPRTWLDRLLRVLVKLTHRECDNLVCRYSSFMYGSGHPTLWLHENLNHETHHWLENEFGFLPLNFYRQMSRSINKGHLLAVDGFAELPEDMVECQPKTCARFAFFAGAKNACFLAESQRKTFEHFNQIRPGYHSLHIIENYGHLCMFMGEHAARDVFPLMLKELEKN